MFSCKETHPSRFLEDCLAHILERSETISLFERVLCSMLPQGEVCMRSCLSQEIDTTCSCASQEPVLNGEIPMDGAVAP